MKTEKNLKTWYVHAVTGYPDTKGGWISSYDKKELDARGITAEEAFAEDDGKTLHQIGDATKT